MTDKELLTAAAKAVNGGSWHPLTHGVPWNPLNDDGDALRMAVKLGLQIDAAAHSASAGMDKWFAQAGERDPYAATRRAIVRAAASIAT